MSHGKVEVIILLKQLTDKLLLKLKVAILEFLEHRNQPMKVFLFVFEDFCNVIY